MAEHNKLGEEGEKTALGFLRNKGLEILETNWRSGREEVDIIAMDKDALVIIEVKTRTSGYSGSPEEFVTTQKQRRLIKVANDYIEQKDFNGETRFDIISIIIKDGIEQIEHLEDAYYPNVK